MSEQEKLPTRFIGYRAAGEGVPKIIQPRMFHDAQKQWAYDVPADVTSYLQKEFGQDIRVVVPDVPDVSRGYCKYHAVKNGEVAGKLELGGDYLKPGTQSAWFLFRK